MEMQNVLTSFQMLCDNPVAWAVIALVAAKTIYSILYFTHCPILRNHLNLSPEVAETMVERRVLHSPRFLALMLAGILLAVGGLYTLSHPDYGPAGLVAIVLGGFILIAEPTQLSIEENQLRVVAVGPEQGEARDLAIDRLRWSHFERIGIESALTVGLALIVAIY
jgi:hypothetical protein